jgi:hypothetical protein
MFEVGSLVMLVGPPGAFKSFLAIDWALSLATGRPWNGKPGPEPSRILYALGEGKASLLKRINTWVHANDLTEHERKILNANFRVTFDVPQLADPRRTTEFLTAMDMEEYKPDVLIVDTLARSFVGRDENSQTDTGLWIESADRLRQKDMTIIVLHHTKKNTEFGLQYRGSTALQGAMDTAFILQKNPEDHKGYAKLTCSKQKEHQEPEDVWFKWHSVCPPGVEEGSIVLIPTERPGQDEYEEHAANEAEIDAMIADLIANGAYNSDRARARDLAAKANMPETTAQKRISRTRKRMEIVGPVVDAEF